MNTRIDDTEKFVSKSFGKAQAIMEQVKYCVESGNIPPNDGGNGDDINIGRIEELKSEVMRLN